MMGVFEAMGLTEVPPPEVTAVREPGKPAVIRLDPAAKEECDRCGPGIPAAWVIILPKGKGQLSLCSHHAREHGFIR